jgi:hypothetical protein
LDLHPKLARDACNAHLPSGRNLQILFSLP